MIHHIKNHIDRTIIIAVYYARTVLRTDLCYKKALLLKIIFNSNFSVLEEYFTMNYEIKLDEGNEENLTLYVGDLNLKVR